MIKSRRTSGLRLPIVIVLSGCRISPWIRSLIRFAQKSTSGICFAASICAGKILPRRTAVRRNDAPQARRFGWHSLASGDAQHGRGVHAVCLNLAGVFRVAIVLLPFTSRSGEMQLLLTVEKRHSVGIQQAEWLQQVERVLETLNEGVIVSDDLSRILSVNSRFEEMTGIPRKEIIGEEASHFYSPREADLIAKQKERGMRQGHNRFEFVLPKKGGSRLPVIISSRVMHSPDGGQFGVITFTDISEQKR